jgi:hypothetical protein
MRYIDGVISSDETISYRETLLSYPFKYGEVDTPGLPATGMVHDFSSDDEIYRKVLSACQKAFPEIEGKTPYRAYLNLFMPNEKPFFHIDGTGLTILVYLNPMYSYDEGGETQFIDNDNCIYGVLPTPGRAVIFNGMILHRATSFRTATRLTMAIKYE